MILHDQRLLDLRAQIRTVGLGGGKLTAQWSGFQLRRQATILLQHSGEGH